MNYWIITFLFVGPLAAMFGQGLEFKEYPVPNTNIVFSFPEKPQETVSVKETAKGIKEVHVSVSVQESAVFYFSYFQHLADTDTTADLEAELDYVRDQNVQSTKGKLISEQKITVQGFPGRDLKIEFPRGKTMVVLRICLINKSLYQIGATVPLSDTVSDELKRYLNSLKIK